MRFSVGIFLFFICFLIHRDAFPQSGSQRTVQGKITDKVTGEGVAYASVGIKGNSIGTSSNAVGYFFLNIPEPLASTGFVLTVSSVGYETFELENADNDAVIRLTPSTIQLKEVLIHNKNLQPEKIVHRAFSSIRKNYDTNPFVYKSFYRHYCKDDTVYGRLIEAAVDIYKRKGYKFLQPVPGYKEEVKVTQLRRSFDNTKISQSHLPIGLYSVMGVDPISYQVKVGKKSSADIFTRYEVSTLKKNLKLFEFSFEGMSEYDGTEVYIIGYTVKKDSIELGSGGKYPNKQTGILYISTTDYAIVKSEWNRHTTLDSINSSSIYKKYNGKYYHQHTRKEGFTLNSQNGERHMFHLELMTNEIVLKDFTPFKGREPGREELLSINYDSVFWRNYTILKATPLEESIVEDLQKERALDQQFTDYVAIERDRYFEGKKAETEFWSFLKTIKGNRPAYIDLWASWCGPCMREMNFSKALVAKYRSRIAFVYLSLDENRGSWLKAIKEYGLGTMGFHHFRLGSQSDILRMFEVNEIPRYLLVNKNGEFVNTFARPPSDPDLEYDFEKLLAEQVDK